MSKLNQIIQRFGLEAESDEALLAESGVGINPEEMEDAPYEHESLDSVREAQGLSENLEQLEANVDAAPETASVEHYHWMMDTLISNAGMPKAKSLGLENFSNSDSGKYLLSRGIRSYNSTLKSKIALALEAYAGNYAKRLSDGMDDVEERLKRIDQQLINSGMLKTVARIGGDRVWQMLHVNGNLVDPDWAVSNELRNLDSVLAACNSVIDDYVDVLKNFNGDKVDEAIKKIESSHNKMKSVRVDLMFNRKMIADSSGVKVEEGSVRKPGKDGDINKRAVGWTIFWVFFFYPVAIVRLFTAKHNFNEDEMERKKDELIRILQKLSDGRKMVYETNGKFDEFAEKLDSCDSTELVSTVKENTAPIIETISAVLKQYNELIDSFLAIAATLSSR